MEENLDSLKGCFLIKPFRVPNTLKKGQKVWNLKRLGLKIKSLFGFSFYLSSSLFQKNTKAFLACFLALEIGVLESLGLDFLDCLSSFALKILKLHALAFSKESL